MPPTVQPPDVQSLSMLLPAEPLLLMGAGPVPIPHAVGQANGVVINHLGPTMDRVIDGLKRMAAYAFQTRSEKVIGVAGSASAAMEMAVSNLAWPGRRVLSLVSGTFSGRLGEMAIGVGADVVVVESPTATPITSEMVADALKQGPFDVVTIVQGETSCGVLNVDLPEIARRVKEHGALLIVDAVCTLTTMPLRMDEWGIDVVVTGGQKGLSSIPGVSLIAFSESAWDAVRARPRPMPHWCLDAQRAWSFWGHHRYHYTAPVPGILALYQALRLINLETLEVRFQRHAKCSRALQAGIVAMGLELFVPPDYRLPSVVAIRAPRGVDPSEVRRHMATSHGVEIAGAFGLDIIRIGQMGEQCRSHRLFHVLSALGESYRKHGLNLDVAGGMGALEASLGES
jgi:alanine-glyoxylate transaminase / serine-glyoxylate transaminase / serine-pyruvate transaminase